MNPEEIELLKGFFLKRISLHSWRDHIRHAIKFQNKTPKEAVDHFMNKPEFQLYWKISDKSCEEWLDKTLEGYIKNEEVERNPDKIPAIDSVGS
jgi:hypothetical protein